MNKIAALFLITRPINVIITALTIAAGYLISIQGEISLFIMVSAALSGGLTAASGNIINDIFDLEADKVNHPERPLPTQTLTYNGAKKFWFLLTLFSFIVSSFVDVYAFLIILLVNLLLIFYSYKFKSLPLWGNPVVSVLTAAAFFYGAYAAGNFDRILIPCIFAFLINYTRELIKDVEDIKGDLAAGVLTFPGRYGLAVTKKLVVYFILLIIFLTLYIFFAGYYKIEFFILMMMIVNPLFIYIIKVLYFSNDFKNYSRISGILKFNMAVGLIAIYIGQ